MPLTSVVWCDIEQRLTLSLSVQKRIRFIHSTLLFRRVMMILPQFQSRGCITDSTEHAWSDKIKVVEFTYELYVYFIAISIILEFLKPEYRQCKYEYK